MRHLTTTQADGVPLASNQIQYSLLYRVPETNGVIEACNEVGATVIAYSPLAQGLLTGLPPPTSPPTTLVPNLGMHFSRVFRPTPGLVAQKSLPPRHFTMEYKPVYGH